METNEELKKKLELLKEQHKTKNESIKLKKEISDLENKLKVKSKTEKITIVIGKGFLNLAKNINKSLEKKYKKK